MGRTGHSHRVATDEVPEEATNNKVPSTRAYTTRDEIDSADTVLVIRQIGKITDVLGGTNHTFTTRRTE
jgi:hypothetical protein